MDLLFKKLLYSLAVIILLVLFSGQNPGLLAQNDNSSLIRKVKGAVETEYADHNFEIQSHKTGQIEINGSVRTLYDKYRIYDLISRVPGVKEITDNLEVDTENLPDAIIRENIISELRLVNSILEPDRIKPVVDEGEVILSGEVSYPREKIMAETVASWQKGVRGITNNIRVMKPDSAQSDQNLNFLISEIIKYRFPLEKNITYKVDEGVVTLDGTVTSLYERNHSQKAIAGIAGVKKVVNRLKVQNVM
jgi:osmotically-inducible protein OsmY